MTHCRHPESSKRLTFKDLMKELSLPATDLLQWSDEDRSVHPEAAKLGAPLLSAEDLYKDIQTTYQSVSQ